MAVTLILGFDAATVGTHPTPTDQREIITASAEVESSAAAVAAGTLSGSTTYQEGSSRITYRGRWSATTYAGYLGRRAKWSKARGASATLTFTGTGVSWIGPTGPTRGKAKVYINGHYVKTVTTYSRSFAARRVLFTASYVTPKTRTLKIVVAGTAGHPTVAIDAFVVRRSEAAAAPAPAYVAPPPAGGFPGDTTLRFLATSSLARPGYLTPSTDPTFGTSITRISNTAGVRHVYSRTPAWNSDQTKILLSFSYPGRLLDGTTYADLGSFNHVPQATWANTNPNALYGVSGNQFIRQNATTEGRTTLHTFAAYSSISIGDYEGGIDDNDTYVSLIGTTSGGSKHLLTYNIATDTVVADIAAPANMDNAQISRKGNYVVVVGTGYTRRYDRALTSFITLYQYGHHGDNALDASGNEIFVANATDNGVESFRLSTGAATVLLPSRTAFDAGHVSGRNVDRPGWVYLSNYDPTIYGFNYLWPGRDQVVALKTDGSGTVEVFAFAHHSVLAYQNEPQAVPSRDGKRVIFASEWGGSSVYDFVASK
jgi:hypothetical protein